MRKGTNETYLITNEEAQSASQVELRHRERSRDSGSRSGNDAFHADPCDEVLHVRCKAERYRLARADERLALSES